jgi:hypothetical protein
MPATLAALLAAKPRDLPIAALLTGKVRVMRERFNLATDVAGSYAIGGMLPANSVPLFGVLNTDTSLGTSTIAIGVAGATGKYRAAAVFTTINTPTLFGVLGGIGVPLVTEEQMLLTVAVASLPASGFLDIAMFYAHSN